MFVTLGGYSSDAVHISRTRHDLRLVIGTQLVEMVLEHYEQFDEEWRREIPLRRVYVVDRG